MDNQKATKSAPTKPEKINKPRNAWRTLAIIFITVALVLGLGYWVTAAYLFPTSFNPVELSQKQQQKLDQKLKRLSTGRASSTQQPLEPEAYSEKRADREIYFSEKELNALVHRNTNLADKLAIDLSKDLASAKLLVDVHPDFPVLGGKTIKVTGGMELQLVAGRLNARLKGISVWGIPLPNAWLGNMKEVDLIQEFGQSGGFWQAVNEGVEEVSITEGRLRIKLRE